jgi:uncharacterized protein (DUF885 family)
VQNDLPTFMATLHPIQNAEDAEHYLTRLSKFYVKFQQVLKGLQVRTKMEIIPPRFVLDRVLEEMQDFIDAPAEECILYTSLQEKLSKAGGISPEEKEQFLARAEATIRGQVVPAYQRLIDYCAMLRDRATTEDGVWKLPNGDAFYAYCLRSQTTTSLTPEEVHQFGLGEVERISAEMNTVLEGLGRTGNPVGERMRELQADPRFKYPDSDEGRAQCLADYQAIIDEIDKGLGGAFDLRPAIGVKVERVPPFKEKTAPGAYYNSPALDGSRPGVFYANLRDMNEIAKWGMRTLAYHEAIPGHHFQLAIQQQIKGPTFRKVLPFTAYTEGWALYAERLAWELGYHEDPYSNLGRLQAELFRDVRLVVDTGIHYKRWTREESIAYMIEKTGMGDKEVQAEIERYIVSPGQACAYKIGMMKILDLREKAKHELGDKFTLKGFHNAVLANGAMPMEVLEKVVNRYIAAENRNRS